MYVFCDVHHTTTQTAPEDNAVLCCVESCRCSISRGTPKRTSLTARADEDEDEDEDKSRTRPLACVLLPRVVIDHSLQSVATFACTVLYILYFNNPTNKQLILPIISFCVCVCVCLFYYLIKHCD
jgi:hypothetical protein